MTRVVLDGAWNAAAGRLNACGGVIPLGDSGRLGGWLAFPAMQRMPDIPWVGVRISGCWRGDEGEAVWRASWREAAASCRAGIRSAACS